MTRRELDRLSGAVKRISTHQGDLNHASVSVQIGRAALLNGSAEAWAKWLIACGWPKEIAGKMAELEAERGRG
jgi:hypothetical protein